MVTSSSSQLSTDPELGEMNAGSSRDLESIVRRLRKG